MIEETEKSLEEMKTIYIELLQEKQALEKEKTRLKIIVKDRERQIEDLKEKLSAAQSWANYD